MPLSSKVRDRCRPYLGTDERIQYVLPGMSLYVNGMHARVGAAVRAANLEISGDACPHRGAMPIAEGRAGLPGLVGQARTSSSTSVTPAKVFTSSLWMRTTHFSSVCTSG